MFDVLFGMIRSSASQRRQIHFLRFLPNFRSADRQPKLGIHHMKRGASGQGTHVISYLIFASSRQFELDLKNVFWKKVGAGISRESAIEVWLFHQSIQGAVWFQKCDAKTPRFI